jgi:hypothetical protein
MVPWAKKLSSRALIVNLARNQVNNPFRRLSACENRGPPHSTGTRLQVLANTEKFTSKKTNFSHWSCFALSTPSSAQVRAKSAVHGAIRLSRCYHLEGSLQTSYRRTCKKTNQFPTQPLSMADLQLADKHFL